MTKTKNGVIIDDFRMYYSDIDGIDSFLRQMKINETSYFANKLVEYKIIEIGIFGYIRGKNFNVVYEALDEIYNK